eukprot:1039670-Karenia_brevis.AAC.1
MSIMMMTMMMTLTILITMMMIITIINITSADTVNWEFVCIAKPREAPGRPWGRSPGRPGKVRTG